MLCIGNKNSVLYTGNKTQCFAWKIGERVGRGMRFRDGLLRISKKNGIFVVGFVVIANTRLFDGKLSSKYQ